MVKAYIPTTAYSKLQQKQHELLATEIDAILTPLSEVHDLYTVVREPLTQGSRGLNIEDHRSWPLLPLTVCESICGRYEHAVPVAAALQLFMAAGDVFDDIEDADSSQSLLAQYGPPIATNAAASLLILAEGALARLHTKGVNAETIVHILKQVNSYYVTACAGQHRDLLLGTEETITEESYLHIVTMKSASQIELTCHLGALLADANAELIKLFSEFGQNLGMAAQISNDIQGITRGNDITSCNITLPVIFALTQAGDNDLNLLKDTFIQKSGDKHDPEEIRDLLYKIGAVHYAMIKVELYRQRAIDALTRAGRAGINIENLKLFLE